MKSRAVIPVEPGDEALACASFGGRPLIAHSIEAAGASDAIESVTLTGGGERLREVADAWGARLAQASPALKGEMTLSWRFPLRRPGMIDNALEYYRLEPERSCCSARLVHGQVWSGEGSFSAGGGWEETGALSIAGASAEDRPRPLFLDPLASLRIRSPHDFELLESLWFEHGVRFRRHDLSTIELVAFDFDGVMTDDAVLVREDGTETVRAHRGDGLGLERLRDSGVAVVVISKERNRVVRARCEKLSIPCHHGIDDKLPLLQDYARERGVSQEHVAFVGNDINDVPCLEWAGLGIAVGNSRPEALAAANWHTRRRGGDGAVREICEAILSARRGVA